jgi:hypothetical protein
MFPTFGYTALAVLLLLSSQTPTAPTIRIWKVGSPHTGATPHDGMPPALAREAAGRGWRLSVEAFPAQGFASRFLAAVRDGSDPDLLVFDNFGIIQGITTELGTFVGVGENPAIRKRLIQVTSSFDELLGPQRGWTFLVASSTNHDTARQLALRPAHCGGTASAQGVPSDLAVAEVAAAYLAGDTAAMLSHADPERLTGLRANREPVRVGGVVVCEGWGNERLAFVTVNASYQADTTIGHASLLLAFRRTSSQWRLLVAARDPVSNRQFTRQLPALSRLLVRDSAAGPVPAPATVRSPQTGQFPIPANGARFGDFEWRSSRSPDVVAEIAEFSYHDDARLILVPTRSAGAPRRVSTGQLWSTRDEWAWRIWSISGSGEIALSEVRTFVH